MNCFALALGKGRASGERASGVLATLMEKDFVFRNFKWPHNKHPHPLRSKASATANQCTFWRYLRSALIVDPHLDGPASSMPCPQLYQIGDVQGYRLIVPKALPRLSHKFAMAIHGIPALKFHWCFHVLGLSRWKSPMFFRSKDVNWHGAMFVHRVL